jgi:hypothetical protein
MKREVLIHSSFLFTFFVFVHLVKRWFNYSYYPLWIGGILGTILPDIDHLLYVYVLKPQEPLSLKVREMFKNKQYIPAIKLLESQRGKLVGLIFHSAGFQLLFLVLAFLVVTSSGSIFGRGLVLAFSLHLLVDELSDLMASGNLNGWFRQFPFGLDRQKQVLYWVANALILLIFGLFM